MTNIYQLVDQLTMSSKKSEKAAGPNQNQRPHVTKIKLLIVTQSFSASHQSSHLKNDSQNIMFKKWVNGPVNHTLGVISVYVYIDNKNKGNKSENSNMNMAGYLHFWHTSNLITFCIKSPVIKILNNYYIMIEEHNY